MAGRFERRAQPKKRDDFRGARDAKLRRRTDEREREVRHDEPSIPEDIQANQLDKFARAELKTLSKENADQVARHLVATARFIDEDPERAHRHALAAVRRAGRIAVVRETAAITAYELGDFALALRELRTYRRLSGKDDQLPLMVDALRGVGRPEAALELGRSVSRETLEQQVQVSLAIAMSGARLDLGKKEQALSELQFVSAHPDKAFPWSPALFDAYASVYEELGDLAEAQKWRDRAERAEQALETAARQGETVEIVEEILADPTAQER